MIFGYETSLSRLMDCEPIDTETLAKIQFRAEGYPELSTGMISASKIDKSLYQKNKHELILKEVLWSSTNVAYKPNEGSSLRMFGDIDGLLMTNGMTARIPVSGREISLLFWGHDWSGIVEIICGDFKVSKDLYSEVGGFIRVDFDNQNLAREVVFHHMGKKNSRANSDQVIFFKMIEYISKEDVLPLIAESENLKKDAFLIKHQKLTSIVCCPNCLGPLSYPMADFISIVPIQGAIVCLKCGEVGRVSNLKYLFTPVDMPNFSGNGRDYTGSLSVKPVALYSHMFSPTGAWKLLEGEQFWSAQEKAKFSFNCNCLGVALIFLKHPWSGIAGVLVDGNEVGTIDLFEEKGSMQIWYPIYLGGGNHLIEVEVKGNRHPLSKDSQIFILCAETLELNSSSELNIKYSASNNGNPYPKCFDVLIGNVPDDGLILDCGSGDRSHPDSRVINFEYSRFKSPDIFGDGHKLPFKDNSFDLVLSQAVIEHLYDPFTAVSEILRVLKPGGMVYVESAFMQPLHAVPYHFFNTTAWGLERLFKDFNILEVKHEGQLSQTFSWFYSLTALREKGLGDKVDEILGIAKELDNHITNEELKSFSSFVALLAKKPEVE